MQPRWTQPVQQRHFTTMTYNWVHLNCLHSRQNHYIAPRSERNAFSKCTWTRPTDTARLQRKNSAHLAMSQLLIDGNILTTIPSRVTQRKRPCAKKQFQISIRVSKKSVAQFQNGWASTQHIPSVPWRLITRVRLTDLRHSHAKFGEGRARSLAIIRPTLYQLR